MFNINLCTDFNIIKFFGYIVGYILILSFIIIFLIKFIIKLIINLNLLLVYFKEKKYILYFSNIIIILVISSLLYKLNIIFVNKINLDYYLIELENSKNCYELANYITFELCKINEQIINDENNNKNINNNLKNDLTNNQFICIILISLIISLIFVISTYSTYFFIKNSINNYLNIKEFSNSLIEEKTEYNIYYLSLLEKFKLEKDNNIFFNLNYEKEEFYILNSEKKQFLLNCVEKKDKLSIEMRNMISKFSKLEHILLFDLIAKNKNKQNIWECFDLKNSSKIYNISNFYNILDFFEIMYEYNKIELQIQKELID